ncbi:MAG: hypothetical protein FK731_02940 [Asgard group archaeon]|nr:hypothetical protein [Asgard group archaeon]
MMKKRIEEDFNQVIEACENISEYYLFEGQLENLESILSMMKKISELQEVTEEQQARCLICEANLKQRKSFLEAEVDLTIERKMLEKGLLLAEKSNNKELQARALNTIGSCIYREGIQRGIFDEALEYYEKALKISKEIDDKRGIADNLFSMGLFYENKRDGTEKEREKSNQFYEEALIIAEKGKCMTEMALINRHLAFHELRIKDYEKALDYALKSLKIREEIGMKVFMPFQYLAIGDIYYEKKELEKARDYFQKAYLAAGKIGLENIISERFKLHLEFVEDRYLETNKEILLGIYEKMAIIAKAGKNKELAEIIKKKIKSLGK